MRGLVLKSEMRSTLSIILVFVVFLLCLSVCIEDSVAAACTSLLASYEPDEVSNLIVSPNPIFSPTMDVNWPVQGGVNGVPPATEGEYVLGLCWTNEPDRKIEVKHEWRESTFDLTDYILVDVYFATESALPDCDKKNISIWSQWWVELPEGQADWISSDCVPTTIGEWHTVLLNVSEIERKNCNSITALIFEEMGKAGDIDGCIYIDNLRIGSPEDIIHRNVNFAGYDWFVKDSGCGTMGPGPNYFSDSKENVRVDENGNLRLKIEQRCEKWYCGEVIANATPGYGKYVFTVNGKLDELDENIIVGLFTWDTDAPQYNYREIDVEIGRWGEPENDNVQYVVQPYCHTGNLYRFTIAGIETTTHEFVWQPDDICFKSYYGDFTPAPLPEDIIACWHYTGNDVPPAGGENPRINFWLLPPKGSPAGTPGGPPASGQDAEVIIKDFRYLPITRTKINIHPETLNLSSKGRWVFSFIGLGPDCEAAEIERNSVFLEHQIRADWVWFNKRRRIALAKFNRSELINILEPGQVTLTVTGMLTDGTIFEGTDTIRVIEKLATK